MTIITYRELRLISQWGFPGTLSVSKSAWDTVEDIQTYITREWVAASGKTLPTATAIAAKESAWRTTQLDIIKKTVKRNPDFLFPSKNFQYQGIEDLCRRSGMELVIVGFQRHVFPNVQYPPFSTFLYTNNKYYVY